MKLLALALPFALLTTPAAAQSLTDTHKRIWMPAGKTPMVTWHRVERSTCPAAGNHQTGKGQMIPVATCAQVAEKTGKDTVSASAR